VKFFSKYLVKPIYVFGGFGLWLMLASILVFCYVLYLKIFENTSMIQTPLPVLSAILLLLGVSSILMGLLAEITVRTYFESQGRRVYSVRSLTNFEKAD
jgi:dolichol-phosphate mannosyltransferase